MSLLWASSKYLLKITIDNGNYIKKIKKLILNQYNINDEDNNKIQWLSTIINNWYSVNSSTLQVVGSFTQGNYRFIRSNSKSGGT